LHIFIEEINLDLFDLIPHEINGFWIDLIILIETIKVKWDYAIQDDINHFKRVEGSFKPSYLTRENLMQVLVNTNKGETM